MEEDPKPETKPAVNRPPPRPPHYTTVGLGPDGDDSDKKPKVTVTKIANGEGKFIRHSGDRSQHGHVIITMAPNGRGSGNVIVNDAPASVIPKEYVEAVTEGIRQSLSEGVYDGRPMVDILVRIVDGSYDQVFSNELAFKMAAIFAVKDAIKSAEPMGVD
jgi:elongation factor G